MDFLTQFTDAFNSPGATAGFKVVVVLRILGEGYSALRSGGGLVGIYRGIVFGENVPKPIAKDYKNELKLDQPTKNNEN